MTGLLVPPGQADALADGLVRVLGDPALRQRLDEAGRVRVRTEFGVDKLVEGTVKAYRQAARSRGVRRRAPEWA